MKREVSFLHGSLSLSPPALVGPEDGGGPSGWGEVRGWVCVVGGRLRELEAGQREGQSKRCQGAERSLSAPPDPPVLPMK